MSYRCSFTTEYIETSDYRVIRNAVNVYGNDKSLCFAPPIMWSGFEVPVISGKVGGLNFMDCIDTLRDFFESFEVLRPVKFVVILEDDDILVLKKMPKICKFNECHRIKEWDEPEFLER